MDQLEAEVLSRRWFYRFALPSGRETDCYLPPEMAKIHDTRRQMMLSVLDPLFAGRWAEAEVADVACHQGYFAGELAAMGCRRVLGIDGRPENVEDARLMARARGQENLRFEHGDVRTLDPAALGTFDIVLMLGLIYHLEDPIGALRLARALTKTVCLVETQIAPHLGGITDWGSATSVKPIMGCFAIVDETDELAGANREANLTNISLFPSLDTLLFVMRRLGFARVEVVPPPPGAYEQLASGKRAVVAGYVG